MRVLTVSLLLHVMKNKKTILIIGLIGLVAGAFIFNTFKSAEDNEQQLGPISYFEKEGNPSCILGESFETNALTTEEGVTVAIYLDDSLLNTYTNTKKQIKISLPQALLTLGAHALKITAEHKTLGQTEDERVLYVLSDTPPQTWNITILNQFPHNDSSFTQGLVFSENKLFEGTGDPRGIGATLIGEVALNTGSMIRRKGQPAPVFGEGITIVGDELFQITWQNNMCYVYDKNNFEPLKQFTYAGEGWGITYDGTFLIMSDGSERLTFRDPKTFKEIRVIQAYTHEGAITKLNELEFINGLIYANIWTSNLIAVIDPATGKVLATIDATPAVQKGKGNGEVLNGIAYNPKTKKTYITGKYWSSLFEVQFSAPNRAL